MDQKIAWNNLHKKQTWSPAPCLEFLAFMAEYYWDKKDLHFLDLGAGTGSSTIWLANKGFKVTAVELSKIACNKLLENLSTREKEFVNIINSDVMDVTFPSNSFDCVISISLLECLGLEDSVSLIKNVNTWLKPKGQIFAKIIAEELPEEIAHKEENIRIDIFIPADIEKIFSDFTGPLTITTRYLPNWKPVHNYLKYATKI